jgi:hypothetical protein
MEETRKLYSLNGESLQSFCRTFQEQRPLHTHRYVLRENIIIDLAKYMRWHYQTG